MLEWCVLEVLWCGLNEAVAFSTGVPRILNAARLNQVNESSEERAASKMQIGRIKREKSSPA